MKYIKITEGQGYIAGDCECWCINPLPADDMNSIIRESNKQWDEYMALIDKRVYPNDFVPDELEEHDAPLVRFKITFEVEIQNIQKKESQTE